MYTSTSTQQCYLFAIVLPSIILCMLCVLSLLVVDSVVGKMKALLINILAVELCVWLRQSLYYLLFPLRCILASNIIFLCRIEITGLEKFPAGALGSTTMCIHIARMKKDFPSRICKPLSNQYCPASLTLALYYSQF